MVEEPGTIIELVNLYVAPPPPIFLQPSQLFFMRQPPPPPRGSGGRGGKRQRRLPSPPPPPLPPPPNFLENFINPLENDIYPRVIVQPANQPWVIPKNLNEEPPPPEPRPPKLSPRKTPVMPKLQPVKFSTPAGTSMGGVPVGPPPANASPSAAQLWQTLKLFGPNVTISKLAGPGGNRFLAVMRQPNGQQRQMVFTAEQLNAFRNMVCLQPGPGQSRPNPTRPRPNPPPPPPAQRPAPNPIPMTTGTRVESVPGQRAPLLQMQQSRGPPTQPPAYAYRYSEPPLAMAPPPPPAPAPAPASLPLPNPKPFPFNSNQGQGPGGQGGPGGSGGQRGGHGGGGSGPRKRARTCTGAGARLERERALNAALEAQAAQDPQTTAQAYRNSLLAPRTRDIKKHDPPQ
ncbi:uncharacterized protein Dana_GF16015 [Drosophila ananassae]|uniref:Uncharacterized protein n=1 Tax=Drosophila ananassae TaxID=7217 RepID=B3N175_DROAN|nr:uncharacterized protein Dana_GF16015 [Drosophila ananassae]